MDHLCHKTETKLLEDDLKSLKKFPIKQQQMEKVESMEIDEPATEIKIKTEIPESAENAEGEEKRPKKHPSEEIGEAEVPAKIPKDSKYKMWSMGIIQPATKFKKPTDREITEVNSQF